MTDPLFPTPGAACECAQGHVCKPSWLTNQEWRTGTLEIAIDQVLSRSNKSARSGDPLGKGLNTPGLTTRVDLEAPMDSTYPQPTRHPNTGGA